MQAIGSIFGSGIQAKGQTDAAAANERTVMEMFERGQEATSPYIQAGHAGITGMQDLMTPEGQAAFMESYKNTPMFQNMMDTGTENMLKQASATGGMRTGQTNVAGMKIAPELMMRGMQDAFGRNQTMATMGVSPAQQTAGLSYEAGANVGGVNAQAIANKANIWGNLAGELGGMGADFAKQMTGGLI